MTTQIVKKELKNLSNQLNTLIEKTSVLDQISSRALDKNENFGELKTFDEKGLTKIAENMLEINEKTNVFGRKNTFATNKLMTLTMTTRGHSFRTLRQCISEIERKRGAVKETLTKLKKNKLKTDKIFNEIEIYEEEISMLKSKLKEFECNTVFPNNTDPIIEKLNIKRKINNLEYEKSLQEIKLQEIVSTIADSRVYLEGALKDIASFQDAYKQIKENKQINDDWDEKKFNEEECKFHVRHAFYNAYRDLKAHGRLGMGTLEHLEQFGIIPDQAEMETHKFLSYINNKLYKKNENGSIEIIGDVSHKDFSLWLDEMEIKYGESYKIAMESLGISTLNDDWYTYSNKKE